MQAWALLALVAVANASAAGKAFDCSTDCSQQTQWIQSLRSTASVTSYCASILPKSVPTSTTCVTSTSTSIITVPTTTTCTRTNTPTVTTSVTATVTTCTTTTISKCTSSSIGLNKRAAQPDQGPITDVPSAVPTLVQRSPAEKDCTTTAGPGSAPRPAGPGPQPGGPGSPQQPTGPAGPGTPPRPTGPSSPQPTTSQPGSVSSPDSSKCSCAPYPLYYYNCQGIYEVCQCVNSGPAVTVTSTSTAIVSSTTCRTVEVTTTVQAPAVTSTCSTTKTVTDISTKNLCTTKY